MFIICPVFTKVPDNACIFLKHIITKLQLEN